MAKKRKARRPSRGEREPRRNDKALREADVFEIPGFRMERHGRAIHTRTDRTPEEQHALTTRLAESVEPMRAEIAAKAEGIRRRLAEFTTFDILAALSLRNHLLDPDTYQENSHAGQSMVAEYAALLALKGSYSRGRRIYPDGESIEQLQNDIQDVLKQTILLYVSEDARRTLKAGQCQDDASGLDELRFTMRTHEFGVRNPAYEHHHHEVLRGLFQPFDEFLTSSLGFTVEDAIQLADAIPILMTARFSARLEAAYEGGQAMRDSVRKARSARAKHPSKPAVLEPTEDADKAALYTELARLTPPEVERFIRFTSGEWVFVGSAGMCAFSAEELAAAAHSDVARATSYIEAFAMNFGEVAPDFYEFSPTHPLRTRPLIRHEDRYLCPAPMLLDWAIQPALESALKAAGGRIWNRYESHRHEWLLAKSVQLLKTIMPAAELSTNLYYNQDEDNSKEAELDALGKYDGLVFLIEVKGADLTDPARRGAPDRLRRDLARVIAASHEQAVRAKEYLMGRPEATFRHRDRSPALRVAASDVRDVILMSVSLAPLGHITSLLHAGSASGFFQEGEYSWVISIYDLMVIADLIDLPPVFLHYVKRRVHTAHLGLLEAHDELDIFAYYLFEGLCLDDLAAEMRAEGGPDASLRLLSFTNPLDAYFFYITGARKRAAPKPTRRMDPKLRALIERLDRSQLPGRVDVAMAILDLADNSQRRWIRAVEKARQTARRKRRPSNASIFNERGGGWGLTYMCSDSGRELSDTLQTYCEQQRREYGASNWLGLVESINGPPQIMGVTISTRRQPHQFT